MANSEAENEHEAQMTLERDLNKLEIKAEKIDFKTSVTTIEEKKKWTDKILHDKVLEFNFERKVKTTQDFLRLAYPFWKSYITGDLTADSPFSTIIGQLVMSSPTPLSEDTIRYIFPEKITGTKKLFEDLNTLIIPENFDFSFGQLPHAYKKGEKLTIQQNIVGEVDMEITDIKASFINPSDFINYRENDQNIFLSYIIKNLQLLRIKKEFDNTIIEFMKFTSCMALLCYRALVKDEIVLSNLYHRKKLPTNIQNLCFLSSDHPFCPPCKKFLEHLTSKQTKNNSIPISVMTIIVDKYTEHLKNTSPESKTISSLLMFTCLMSTALNGLTVIKLLQEVRLLIGISPRELVKYFYLDSNKSMWDSIIEYLIETSEIGNRQTSAPWCRLIDDAYYSGLKTDLIANVVVWLAGIVSCDPKHSGIWNSNWAEKHLISNAFAKTMGEKFYAYMKSKEIPQVMTKDMRMYSKLDHMHRDHDNEIPRIEIEKGLTFT